MTMNEVLGTNTGK